MLRCALLATAAAAALLAAMPARAQSFTPGDLVISVEGDGSNTGSYGDNQAAPLTLDELSVNGSNTAASIAASWEMPQVTTVANGVTQYALSGEYGSSSEGTLQDSGNGQYLTIMGYGVNANAFNANPAAYSAAGSGNTALAQSLATAVPRVVGLIGASGSVDTSTALTNVFNENNPRSAWTYDGSSFYVSGQGASKTDTATQGVFYATKGATAATQIYGATDTRDVQVVNGNLYASLDYNPSGGHGPASIMRLTGPGGTLPTTSAGVTPSYLLSTAANNFAEVTVNAADENGVNNSRLGSLVYLSPENYFFANSTTLYVTDSGAPKNGSANAAGLGDGGLQKWTLSNGVWNLDYTLSLGLNLVNNDGTTGVTGLYGLAGKVVGGNVYLYATSYTIADLDKTYVYGIVDSLSNVVDPTGEAFTTLFTAGADENIKGIAFAPVPEPATIALMGAGLAGVLLARRRRDLKV
jgi:hypothetical protein